MPKPKKHTGKQIDGIVHRVDHAATAEWVGRYGNSGRVTWYCWKPKFVALSTLRIASAQKEATRILDGLL